eukprot:CAMPEP_0179072386 /NCGR_PEP_ID=MMETSP0796-20121207/32028_1 /TAXON_ID=73915 /ORGANISM="Pyrodinium bahamense, Strain pbaha01" /LENGTH=138 /DNA_ID=CAMNT_0020769545 /DNA_START=241 /DNA_END=654 /DNA_ORIENTATION=-
MVPALPGRQVAQAPRRAVVGFARARRAANPPGTARARCWATQGARPSPAQLCPRRLPNPRALAPVSTSSSEPLAQASRTPNCTPRRRAPLSGRWPASRNALVDRRLPAAAAAGAGAALRQRGRLGLAAAHPGSGSGPS